MKKLFAPNSVAIVGASEREGSIGLQIVKNLIKSEYKGTVYAVNPKRKTVKGLKCFDRIQDIPSEIDLAIVATPAHIVPQVIRDCVKAGVGHAVVISAGFREIGFSGAKLEEEIRNTLKNSSLRITGPNCIGIMNPYLGLNATFTRRAALPGNIAFLSQSGALCESILDWSIREKIGFSTFISLGSMIDIGWSEVLYYLADDYRTKAIIIYMESIENVRSFISAAREVAYSKPIIVLKGGRSKPGVSASVAHTGGLPGDDAVFEAIFRRCGILRVHTIEELFNMASLLGKQKAPKGPGLRIITNAGGPGIIATDAYAEQGGNIPVLERSLLLELNKFLPEEWSHNNPLDLLSDATPEQYEKALRLIVKDKDTDGVLVILSPQVYTSPSETARRIAIVASETEKPIITSWMGGDYVAEGIQILHNEGIPTFPYPDTAARVFYFMWKHAYNLRGIYETPRSVTVSNTAQKERNEAKVTLKKLREHQKFEILTEAESKNILRGYRIPCIETLTANSLEETLGHANQIGYPVVLKPSIRSKKHKAAIGGVYLQIQNAESLKVAYKKLTEKARESLEQADFSQVSVQKMHEYRGAEIIIGCRFDSQAGPIMYFGHGGRLIEVYQDTALGLPPLNTTLAHRMMEQTGIYAVLKENDRFHDEVTKQLESVMIAVSELVTENPEIKSVKLDPIAVSANEVMVLDAKIELHDSELDLNQIPEPAIRPYPSVYESQHRLKNNVNVLLRPIRADDEPLVAEFHKTLSNESVYFRYFHSVSYDSRVAHERLAKLCFVDYDQEITLVSEVKDKNGTLSIVAAMRLVRLYNSPDAEFAIMVSDNYQRTGIGTLLMKKMIRVAENENMRNIIADILPDNHGMLALCRKAGFDLKYNRSEEVMKVAYRNKSFT